MDIHHKMFSRRRSHKYALTPFRFISKVRFQSPVAFAAPHVVVVDEESVLLIRTSRSKNQSKRDSYSSNSSSTTTTSCRCLVECGVLRTWYFSNPRSVEDFEPPQRGVKDFEPPQRGGSSRLVDMCGGYVTCDPYKGASAQRASWRRSKYSAILIPKYGYPGMLPRCCSYQPGLLGKILFQGTVRRLGTQKPFVDWVHRWLAAQPGLI